MNNNQQTETKMSKPSIAERFMLYNNIDKFRGFQNEIIEKFYNERRICAITSSGNGKTTLMKYLTFDFLDQNKNNRIIIFCNTRFLSLDISNSLLETLENEELNYVCNLCSYTKDNKLTPDIINKSKIFVSTPGKYCKLKNMVGRNFKFVCVDEIDSLMDYKDSIEQSEIITIFSQITYDYSLIVTATINDDVYKHFLDRFDFISRKFETEESDIKYVKLKFNKKEKDWYSTVIDKIFYIIESDQLKKKKSIVFCNYKDDCNLLFNEYPANYGQFFCHGDCSTETLNQTLIDFRETGTILFTTDMSQRGINVEDIENVFHIGVTAEQNFYHRNGRALRRIDSDATCYIFYDTFDASNPILKNATELKV